MLPRSRRGYFTGFGNTWQVTLPGCIFPAYRGDGAPSHVSTLLPDHPIARGLPERWDIPQTEMYDEPFHVPTPDAVVFPRSVYEVVRLMRWAAANSDGRASRSTSLPMS